MTEFTYQCEKCGDQVPESKAETTGRPGVHGRPPAAYCPECSDR